MAQNLRFARYAAVSTREQLKPGKYSIQNQLEKALTAASELGWVETAGPFIVEGQSRENHIDLGDAEREIIPLRNMIQAARAGQFDVLVSAETDRFRSLLIQVFRRLAQYHTQLYFLNLPIEPVPPDQYNIYKADNVLMMLTMSQMTSSLEIARTRRKWFENMPKRITHLGLPATSLPFGYRKPNNAQYDRKAVPEPDPLLTPHIIKIKDLLLTGHSTRQLVDYLEQNHVPPPRGNVWYPQTVRDILRNPFYAGTVRFGITRVILDPLTDRKKRDRSIPPDQIQQGAGRHIPLWDWTTHQLIHLELKRRRRNYRGRSNNQFTALLKCGTCGASLWRQGNGPRGNYRLIWRCSSTGTAAGHINIPHVILLQKIAHELTKLVPVNPQHLGGRAEGAGGSLPTSHFPLSTEEQLTALETQLTRLEDAYLAGQWDLPRYTERKRRIDAQLAKLKEDQAQAQLHALQRQQQTAALQQLQTIPDLHAWLTTADPAEINQRLHFLIDHITIRETGIKIELK